MKKEDLSESRLDIELEREVITEVQGQQYYRDPRLSIPLSAQLMEQIVIELKGIKEELKKLTEKKGKEKAANE